MTSWSYREGFFGRADASDVPNAKTLQLSWMISLAEEWAEPFRSIVKDIPGHSEVKPVELLDWIPQRNAEMIFGGRMVLLGDAQHAMVMYRGGAANHAIVDVSVLLDRLRPLYASTEVDALDQKFKDAVRSYEEEVVERTEIAVLASRQACLDAHDAKRINENGPLIRRRLMRTDLEDMQRQL